jgi:sulfite reductase (NADPH) flavoprotein alpha-component
MALTNTGLTWRNLWFQTHWLIGISAGVVLAIVGFTGALLSFEEEILRALNPDVMTVEPAGRARLRPDQLLTIAGKVDASKRVSSLNIDSRADASVRATLIDEARAASGGPGARRGVPVYLDPYSGSVIGGERRGEGAMHVIEDVHRRLAAGDSGKLIVGISTLLLLVIAATGLYLRWPRVAASLRTWFTFRWALRGRTFLWHLHAVVGTWVLLFYLLASLTGLYWSFEWYRDGLFAMTGAPRPQNQAQGHQGSQGKPRTQGEVSKFDPAALAAPWVAFTQAVPHYDTVTITVPKEAGKAIELRYLDVDSPHERAYNRMTIEAASGVVLTHERYDDKPLGHKIMGSMFALHSGSFFGVGGFLAMFVASLCMPLFAVTGWMMYLERRRRKKAARASSTVSDADALGEAGEVAGAVGIEPTTR